MAVFFLGFRSQRSPWPKKEAAPTKGSRPLPVEPSRQHGPCFRKSCLCSRRGLEALFLICMGLAPLLHLGVFGERQRWLLPTTVRSSQLASFAQSTRPSSEHSVEAVNSNSHQNKTLVILMGDLRCGEPCWNSLQQNVLQPNQADLALLIQPPPPQYQNSSLLNIAKYHWPVPNYSNWLDALNIIRTGNENSSEWQQHFFETLSPIYPDSIVLGPIQYQLNKTTTLKFSGSAVIIFYMRYVLSQRIRQLYLTHRYEWFIITRTDQFYWCTHDIASFHKDTLWIPRGEDYGGITDRHLVVHRQHILKALNILQPLLHNPQHYKAFFQQQRHQNSEMFLQLRFQEESLQVQRFPRTMFLAGVPGDSYLWRPAWKPLKKAGVNVKYPKEYANTKRNCLEMKRRQKSNGIMAGSMVHNDSLVG